MQTIISESMFHSHLLLTQVVRTEGLGLAVRRNGRWVLGLGALNFSAGGAKVWLGCVAWGLEDVLGVKAGAWS